MSSASPLSSPNAFEVYRAHVAPSTIHDSSQRYHVAWVQGETEQRSQIQILDWIARRHRGAVLSRTANDVLWLTGSTDHGRSFAANSIAEICKRDEAYVLAASIFIPPSGLVYGRPPKEWFVATLAYQLAGLDGFEGLSGAIIDAIQKDPSIFTNPISEQMDTLISGPLQLIGNNRVHPTACTMLIVVDGLGRRCPGHQQDDQAGSQSPRLNVPDQYDIYSALLRANRDAGFPFLILFTAGDDNGTTRNLVSSQARALKEFSLDSPRSTLRQFFNFNKRHSPRQVTRPTQRYELARWEPELDLEGGSTRSRPILAASQPEDPPLPDLRNRSSFSTVPTFESRASTPDDPGYRANERAPLSDGPNLKSGFTNTNKVDMAESLLLWDTLPEQRDASNDRSEYLEGSRGVDLVKIRAWVETASPDLILWIYGPAGLGKSTLAREVSRDLQTAGLLGAFVPLSSLPNDARDPVTVIKTIAREIGKMHRQAVPAIADAIRECRGASVREHLWHFVGEPIRALQQPSAIAVVLDAFDEWELNDALTRNIDCLIPLSSVIKFIFLGRSDPKSLGHQHPTTRPYPLQPVSTAEMGRYFHREFLKVKWDHGMKPSATDISRLAERADGLFVWASTACSLLQKGAGSASQNKPLEEILASRKEANETGHLEGLYGNVLRSLFPDPEGQNAVRSYLGAILVLQEPLLLDDFSFLSGLTPLLVDTIQTRLEVLHMREANNNTPIVYLAPDLFHLSFIEYLQHTSAPTSSKPPVTPLKVAHLNLAKACLRELEAFRLTSEASLLTTSRQHYAARHWVLHLAEGAPPVEPKSYSEWEQTELSSTLKGIPITTWHQWGGVAMNLSAKYGAQDVSTIDSAGGVLRAVAKGLDDTDLDTITFKISCLSVATHLQPRDADTWSELGDACLDFTRITSSGIRLCQAVAAFESAVEAGGDSEASRRASLGETLVLRFEYFGVMGDLDRAVKLMKSAISLYPFGHPERLHTTTDLAASLYSRFKVTKSLEDLQEAIHLHAEVLKLHPFGHPNRPSSLRNLAVSLCSRFEVTNSVGDLQEAIKLHEEFHILCPAGHPDRSLSLIDLATALRSRFNLINSFDDLEKAIKLLREALALRPLGHMDRPKSIEELAITLESRFQATGSEEDGLEASALRAAP